MAKAAVFASGRGSNFMAIHRYFQETAGSKHQICCLVTDKPECGAVEFAQAQGIPVLYMKYAQGKPREIVESELISTLAPLAPDLLVLAGFMRLLTPTLINAWPQRIINIHPSLLPKFPGRHGIEESFASSDKQLGITIHQVDNGLDSGPILLQKSFDRLGTESLFEIEQHIHELEHATYPRLVYSLLNDISNAL